MRGAGEGGLSADGRRSVSACPLGGRGSGAENQELVGGGFSGSTLSYLLHSVAACVYQQTIRSCG